MCQLIQFEAVYIYRYLWPNGKSVLPDDSEMWAPNYPDNLPDRHCVLHTYITALLVNNRCSGFAYPICEMF